MKKERLLSLDAFRGFTIAGMIVVNNPGSWDHVYSPLLHSEWAGCTPTDLVFPFFLFIVGVSMWFSFRTFDHKFSKLFLIKVLRRSLVIFMLGIFLNGFPFINFEWHSFRILGVLQRIAIAYAFAAFLCMILNRRLLIISSIVILTGYYLMLIFCGNADPFSLSGNLVKHIDIAVLGENHLYKGFGIPFDPEGLLSTLPSIVTIIIGFLAGNFLDKDLNKESILLRLLLTGVSLMFLGLLFSSIIPIIKALWTSTYVLYTSGLALVTLTFFIFFIDIKKWNLIVQPFVVFGSNPLFIYVFSGILGTLLYVIPIGQVSLKDFTYNYVVQFSGYRSGSLLCALLLVIICWFVAWLLYRKKIYIKI
jgi:predicted acyltransferase